MQNESVKYEKSNECDTEVTKGKMKQKKKNDD